MNVIEHVAICIHIGSLVQCNAKLDGVGNVHLAMRAIGHQGPTAIRRAG